CLRPWARVRHHATRPVARHLRGNARQSPVPGGRALRAARPPGVGAQRDRGPEPQGGVRQGRLPQRASPRPDPHGPLGVARGARVGLTFAGGSVPARPAHHRHPSRVISPMRRSALFGLVTPALLIGATGSLASQTPKRPDKGRSSTAAPVSVVETSITDLRTALEQHRTTSRAIVEQYLQRIATYEDRLNAVVTVNPNALAIADSLDRLRARGVILGPLHGIPVALKDNIHDVEMPTTGGALAFADLVPPYDATLTRNLKAAGAIILAKTQLTELANWVATGMPGNYNALTGYGMNPWDPRRDPRDNFFDGRPV